MQLQANAVRCAQGYAEIPCSSAAASSAGLSCSPQLPFAFTPSSQSCSLLNNKSGAALMEAHTLGRQEAGKAAGLWPSSDVSHGRREVLKRGGGRSTNKGREELHCTASCLTPAACHLSISHRSCEPPGQQPCWGQHFMHHPGSPITRQWPVGTSAHGS